MRKPALTLVVVAVLVVFGLLWMRSTHPSLDQKIAACKGIPNGSVEKIAETTRLFINLPKDVYPSKEHSLVFTTATGTAKAMWVSNAGPYGQAFEATDQCWSYYYEFDGAGEIDLAASGTAPYAVRFIVGE